MAAPRKRVNLARRRRLDDEGDDVSVATGVADDSQSDISVPSDVDETADADNSDLSEPDSTPSLTAGKKVRKVSGSRDLKARPDVANRREPSPPIARSDAKFTSTRDTEMMLNGLKIAGKAADEDMVDFDTGSPAVQAPATGPASGRQETFAERKRREHEEYKKKRDSDPAFIPNRGAFFMHDQRSAHGQNGFRPFVRGGGRGRGRGGAIGGPYSPANMMAPPPEATDAPWQHDLHETVINPAPQPQPQPQVPPSQAAAPTSAPTQPMSNAPQQPARVPAQPAPKQPQTRNFSTTVHTHNALVRVFLPGMKAPILFNNVPIKQHTRLPNHRPPLRRDKPVRISLPPAMPRYIFPTVERSFIFIPRALRPNQQGFGRGRGRGFGSFGGGFSSRRTSAYGGSVYSPSVAMSRRSSLAREMGRDGLVSPAGSVMSRPGGFVDNSRPVVRLPPGGPKMPTGPASYPQQNGGPSGNGGPQQPYPLPQKPAFRENWPSQLPMHQPRPQKTVSVAGIESPASMTFNPPPQQEQQPFHQQVPTHITANTSQPDQQQFYPHARQLSYPSQTSTGTPLSNIPERAIHAPAFQPFQQPGFQPQSFAVQPGYYYPPQTSAQPQFMPPGGMVPMFVPNPQQPGFVMPMTAPAAPPAPTSSGQGNMVAYESNGMTYYVDPTQLYAPPPPPMEGYPQPSYAVPGMGGMMTPSPEGAYYYPQQMQPAAFYQQPQ
ncbi:CASC3/Barentsz eIF4AIII binding-domain-containing protein [Clohesyomyces aquaticus]|uniref:CASC3/Barentsz eIF4AIII binding-domain-containing protein n=1 Tax=Clohesyomyces aquaticus TaxID=1231657 RepID=A0A1Y1YEW7_9PLEO|nr:CASC3/Barentsz eIF4AIII binding-domain-containing protein [Clohesyomyces aquaticus]